MDTAFHFAKIYLEITNCCNLHCRFCPGTTRPRHFLSLEEFAVLAGKLRSHSDYLYLHVMGEPLLHPDLAEILRICEDLHFRVILTTNGTLLREKEELLLSSPALYKVNISLHSFEGNEGNSNFTADDYFDSCFTFADHASAKGILCIFRLWNEKSAALPQLKPKNRQNDAILTRLQSAFPDPWTKNTKGYRIRHRLHIEWDEIFAWPDLAAPFSMESHGCYALRDHIAVLCDGSVIPCCLDSEGTLTLGNLFREDLPEILASPRANAIREGFRQGNAAENLCRRCGYAARFAK